MNGNPIEPSTSTSWFFWKATTGSAKNIAWHALLGLASRSIAAEIVLLDNLHVNYAAYLYIHSNRSISLR